MRLHLDCIPCFQRQALQAARFSTDDGTIHKQVLIQVMKKLLQLQWNSTPPQISEKVHSLVRELTTDKDPYRKVKKQSNDLVVRIYPEVREKVEGGEDRLGTAIRLAVAGNIIDYGAMQEFNLEKVIKETLNKDFAIDDRNKLEEKLRHAKTMLYFADNSGEIVLDKLLVETLLKERNLELIDFVVKGGPIINDATIEDALYVGLDRLPSIRFLTVSNGESGTGPDINSQKVSRWIDEHDIVISKGQGNYEGLSGFNGIFFMLIVKCPVIASDIGVKNGSIILKYKS